MKALMFFPRASDDIRAVKPSITPLSSSFRILSFTLGRLRLSCFDNSIIIMQTSSCNNSKILQSIPSILYILYIKNMIVYLNIQKSKLNTFIHSEEYIKLEFHLL